MLASAPTYEGVSHVKGDMFESISNADAIFMKVYKIKVYYPLIFIFSQVRFMCLIYYIYIFNMYSGYCTIGMTKIASRSKKLSKSNPKVNWENHYYWYSNSTRRWWNKVGVWFSDDSAQNRGWVEEIIGGMKVSSLQNLKDFNLADDHWGLSR